MAYPTCLAVGDDQFVEANRVSGMNLASFSWQSTGPNLIQIAEFYHVLSWFLGLSSFMFLSKILSFKTVGDPELLEI